MQIDERATERGAMGGRGNKAALIERGALGHDTLARYRKVADPAPQIDERATSAKHGLRPVPHRLHSLWV
jgi:hypothetical protein